MAEQANRPEDKIEAGTGLTPAGKLPASLVEQLSAAWSKRQPKWYERLAPAQRHWVDKLVAMRLAEFQDDLAALDREDSQLAHQVAELTAQITQLNRRLAAVEARLEQFPNQSGAPGRQGDGQE